MRSINDTMDVVVRALKMEYKSPGLTEEEKRTIRRVMMSIADQVNSQTTRFNRDRFLYRAGHPEWETGRFKLIKEMLQ